MTTRNLSLKNAAPKLATCAGSWHLGRGHALRLCGREAASLRITSGRVWATLDGPYCGALNNQGDLVLEAGQELSVPAGRGVVIEPWGKSPAGVPSDDEAVFFAWDSVAALHSAHLQEGAQTAPRPRLQTAVGDPLRELGQALWQVAKALGHLVVGVAGLSEFLVAGRGRVLPCMESNAP